MDSSREIRREKKKIRSKKYEGRRKKEEYERKSKEESRGRGKMKVIYFITSPIIFKTENVSRYGRSWRCGGGGGGGRQRDLKSLV